ncbi:MAG TPA: hypothetical protein VGR62_17240 [Candidatus Binatia bacterium]|jgi:hypothetical protein|nr:hypothetical protein [Candidatus Binatia bacterium]
MTSNDMAVRLRAVRGGLVLSLLTILVGFTLGGFFGAAEDWLKDGLRASAEAVRDTAYGGDASKLQTVVDKSWTYYKRAHMHGGAIGTAALAMSLLLGILVASSAALRGAVSAALGAGGLGYSLFWLLAARRAPGLGSTGAAKDSLEWLAVPTAGLLLVGTTLTIVLVVRELYGRPPVTSS